ncbi:MAG TPA: efflux RND transporter periplasmic adaptor subunit [Thermoanaerobaculia bacterium]|nr:efflux RND transporter periplasmic adaptor subunit [Thermoanaerobaculia bacterium]
MRRVAWVGVAIAIAVAGAWGYGALVRQENDSGVRVRLLAIAEDQTVDLSFSRAGRIVTRVPDEGESIAAGDLVARIEEPGLAEDAADFERQRAELTAKELTRRQNVEKAKAELAQIASDEKRIARLVGEGVAPAADLETLRHRRDATEAGIRALETERDQLEAQDKTLAVRADKVKHFEKEGTLLSPEAGVVLTRQHREGEWVEAGQPIVTLQTGTPYLRVEVPEERLSTFGVGSSVSVWPQARPQDRFPARVVSVKPRSEFATRRNWGLQSRDLKTFSVRLTPQGAAVIAGQTFVVEAGKS